MNEGGNDSKLYWATVWLLLITGGLVVVAGVTGLYLIFFTGLIL